MTEPASPPPSGPEPPSLLSQRLVAAPASVPLREAPREERLKAALARVGTRLKGWRLHRLLGVGPVGATYEAFFGEGDKGDHAVVKTLLGDAATNERARSLFLRAGYAANRFRHQRVIPIQLDGVDDDGAPFLVRTWQEAKPFATVLEEGPIDEPRALRVAEQVLDALELAHSHGIVHGAITPMNILMTPRGSIRLCDFATPPGVAGSPEDQDVLAALRIGPYSAPERCEIPPTPASQQADIYSLAACLYEALTRKMARGRAKTREELASSEIVPLRDALPDDARVSDALVAILEHALHREPARRYDSAYAMLGDIRRAMAGRKPKLGGAERPVPSGSFGHIPLPEPSSRRMPVIGPPPASETSILKSSSSRRPRRAEWRGNVVLILAISLLVGVATFVLLRERREDETTPPPPPTEAPKSFH